MKNINIDLFNNVFLLVLYFIIRIPLVFFLRMNPTIPIWVKIAIEFCEFLIIGTLIIINRNKLKDFFIDRNFLVIFFLFGIILRNRMVDTKLTLSIEIIIRIFLIMVLILLFITKTRFPRFPVFSLWNFIGIFSGVVLALFVIMFGSNTIKFQFISFNNLIGIGIQELINGFCDVILEEPIFRGFLWGTLLLFNWKEKNIFFTQGLLFWVSHFSYAFTLPITFWIISPIISILLGFLTWKSRSIVPSTLAHVFYNAIIYVSLSLSMS